MATVKAVRNVWGNLNVYRGNSRALECGCAYDPHAERVAHEWLLAALKDGAKLSARSDISQRDLDRFTADGKA